MLSKHVVLLLECMWGDVKYLRDTMNNTKCYKVFNEGSCIYTDVYTDKNKFERCGDMKILQWPSVEGFASKALEQKLVEDERLWGLKWLQRMKKRRWTASNAVPSVNRSVKLKFVQKLALYRLLIYKDNMFKLLFDIKRFDCMQFSIKNCSYHLFKNCFFQNAAWEMFLTNCTRLPFFFFFIIF